MKQMCFMPIVFKESNNNFWMVRLYPAQKEMRRSKRPPQRKSPETAVKDKVLPVNLAPLMLVTW
jgi:hypothetical protein